MRQRVIGSRTGEPSNESHKDKEGWPEMLLGAGSEPRSGSFFKGKIECFCAWRGHFWRVGTVLFCVRGTVGGESVCKGRTKLILCVSLYPAALLAV